MNARARLRADALERDSEVGRVEKDPRLRGGGAHGEGGGTRQVGVPALRGVCLRTRNNGRASARLRSAAARRAVLSGGGRSGARRTEKTRSRKDSDRPREKTAGAALLTCAAAPAPPRPPPPAPTPPPASSWATARPARRPFRPSPARRGAATPSPAHPGRPRRPCWLRGSRRRPPAPLPPPTPGGGFGRRSEARQSGAEPRAARGPAGCCRARIGRGPPGGCRCLLRMCSPRHRRAFPARFGNIWL